MSHLSFAGTGRRARRTRWLPAAMLAAAGCLLAPVAAPAQGLAQQLADADWFERPIADGVVWRHYFFENLFGAYQNVNIIEVDLGNPGVVMNIPYRVPPPSPSYQRLNIMVPAQFPNAVAAINGSYYNISGSGESVTYFRLDGTTIIPDGGAAWSREAAIAIEDDRTVGIVRRPSTGWDNLGGFGTVLAAGPMLREGGTIPTLPTSGHCPSRNPRTMAGVTADNRLLMVTVDGRQQFAAGMTCAEMADFMGALGTVDAFNLDGGGSTTMWVKSEPGFNNTGVVNWFSDSNIRAVADGVAVTSGAATPLAYDARISTRPNNLSVPIKGTNTRDITFVYTNIGTTTWNPGEVRFATARPMDGTSTLAHGSWLSDSVPAVLSPATVPPGATASVTFTIQAPDVNTVQEVVSHFALYREVAGEWVRFGPSDNDAAVRITVEPTVKPGAPDDIIIQAGPGGPNSPRWFELSGTWSTSGFAWPSATGMDNTIGERWMSGHLTTLIRGRFIPIIPVSGTYEVWVTWAALGSRASASTYIVGHRDGTTRSIQNPSATQNTWIRLGEFGFNEGTDGYVELSNEDTPKVSPQNVPAGGVKFVFVEADVPFDERADVWSLH